MGYADYMMSEKTTAIIKQLQDGVTELFASDKYADFLKWCASFHQYSFGNTLLIYLQNPDASYVASFSGWKRKGRQVIRGQKALNIFAPHSYTEKDSDGDDIQHIGFHIAHCFDISQTQPDALHADTAEDIPCICRTIDIPLSDRDSRLLDVLVDISPVPIEYENIRKKSCNGYFSPDDLKIVIDSKLKGTQMEIKTILHEQAHALCLSVKEEQPDRHTMEVQAESIAYIVSNYCGIDTSDYSWGYVCSWSQDKSLKELTESLEIIRKTSNQMIEWIEERLIRDVV